MNDRALVAFMLSASIASTIGGLPFNSLPVMLGSIADSFALDPRAVGLMGSICFVGYLVGTLGDLTPELRDLRAWSRARRR